MPLTHISPPARLFCGTKGPSASLPQLRPCAPVAAGAASSADVVQAFFDIVSTKSRSSPDHLVSLLSDEVLDAAIAHVKGRGGVEAAFDISLDACLTATRARPFLDSYATRATLHSPVASHTPLNAVMTNEGSHLHRCRCVLDSGEVMRLTFVLTKETTQKAAFRSLQLERTWVLSRVSGECEGLPEAPSTTSGPEACLHAQLDALAESDAATVYAFASPDNRAAIGSLANFDAMLNSPTYKPLLRHTDAQVVHARNTGPVEFMALIKVVPHSDVPTKQLPLFVWTIRRQEDGPQQGCWMTDSVQAVPVAFLDVWPTM